MPYTDFLCLQLYWPGMFNVHCSVQLQCTCCSQFMPPLPPMWLFTVAHSTALSQACSCSLVMP